MQLGWIDFSKNERNKIIQTLKILEDSAALDELGIGVIRDGYSDMLFPGISTLQKRAKYFVLLPYIFAMAERGNFEKASDVLPWIRKQEDALVAVLLKNSVDTTGVVGLRAHGQGKTVKTKPLEMYWNGMRVFGIVRNDKLSVSNVCHIIYGKQARKKALSIKTEAKRREGEGFDDETAINENLTMFSSLSANYPFMTEAAIELTSEEAHFLYQKIIASEKVKSSLLAFLLREKLLFPDFNDIDETILPDNLKETVVLAKNFSDFIEGAHIRYNVIYSRSSGEGDAEMADKYIKWQNECRFDSLDLPSVFSKINCDGQTIGFINSFYEASRINDETAIDRLIINREREKKQERAKLCKPQEYKYKRPDDINKLTYRYGTAKTILKDIFDGMGVSNG